MERSSYSFDFVKTVLAGLLAIASIGIRAMASDELLAFVPYDYVRDVEQGSALDFSHLAPLDGPAGKYGWLKVVRGHFEFERAPGKPVRFYGVNLCMDALLPSHADADRLVDRLERMGYNSIRIHHHDNILKASLKRERWDRFDYFLAQAIARGFYLTSDLYVSRKISWREVGIDQDGLIPPRAYKVLVNLHEPTYANYLAWAKAFLNHVNPYTGRAYRDEPALCLLTTVNENWNHMGWKYLKDMHLPCLEEDYRRWRAEKLAQHGVDFMKETLRESYATLTPWKANAATVLYFAELEERAERRRERDLRAMGVKALLTAGNHGKNSVATAMTRSRVYDFVDIHCYVDHPNPKVTTIPASDPLVDFSAYNLNALAFARHQGKPFVATELNHCGLSRTKGLFALYGAALISAQAFDGAWRFAYAHHGGTARIAEGAIGNFDVSQDPLMALGERLFVALYRRGDAGPLVREIVFGFGERELYAPPISGEAKTYDALPMYPKDAPSVLWKMRVACAPAGPSFKGPRLWDCVREEKPIPVDAPDDPRYVCDFQRKIFKVVTDRTCGVYSPPGVEVEAGALLVSNAVCQATISAISLDGHPLATSGRILVCHFTDTQSEKGARVNTAAVTLRLAQPVRYAVYALATSGVRRFRVPAGVGRNALSFSGNLCGADGKAVFAYEIIQEQQEN